MLPQPVQTANTLTSSITGKTDTATMPSTTRVKLCWTTAQVNRARHRPTLHMAIDNSCVAEALQHTEAQSHAGTCGHLPGGMCSRCQGLAARLLPEPADLSQAAIALYLLVCDSRRS